MCHVDGSGHVHKAHEEVEVDGAVGIPGLRRGDDLAEHLTPPEHRPVERRAHVRRLEYLSEVRGFVRVRNHSGALVLYHPPRRPEVQGDAQAVLLRREPVLGDQEMVLTIRCDEEDARGRALALTSPEPAWTEVRLLIPQDLLCRRREVPEGALDVRRIVGGPRVASASVASASARNAWTSRSVTAHFHMVYLHNLLHASHFPGCKPDFDAARVEGGLREDVFHDATGKSPGTLILLLRDVHPQP